MIAAVTLVLSNPHLLLLAAVPFLLVCTIAMLFGFLRGPDSGGFRLTLTWTWLLLVLPSLLLGLWGIALVVFV